MASHLGGTHLAGIGWGVQLSLHPRLHKQEDIPCITQETSLHSPRPPGRRFPWQKRYRSFLRESVMFPFVSFIPSMNLFHKAVLPLGLVHTVSFIHSRHVLITCYSSNKQSKVLGGEKNQVDQSAATLILEVNVYRGSSQAKSRSGSCSGPPTSLHSYSLSQRELESFKPHEAGPMPNTALD